MRLLLLASAVIACKAIVVDAQTSGRPSEPPLRSINGSSFNGLLPIVTIDGGPQWGMEIAFEAQTNFSKNAWMRTRIPTGCRLTAQTLSGAELAITNPAVLAAIHLPAETTVSNIWSGLPRREFIHQWLRLSLDAPKPGDNGVSANFPLSRAFSLPFTNDVVLKMEPLLYRIDADLKTAHLVTFPPIQIKLMTNGLAEALSSSEK